MIAYIDLLSFSLQDHFVECYKKVMDEKKQDIKAKLVLLSAKDNEPQKLINTFTEKNRTSWQPAQGLVADPLPGAFRQTLQESLSEKFSGGVIARKGEGKTYEIKEWCEDEERHRVHMPVHTSNRAKLIKCLGEHMKTHMKKLT